MFGDRSKLNIFKRVKLAEVSKIEGAADEAQALMPGLSKVRRGRESIPDLLRSRFIRMRNTTDDHQTIRDFGEPDELVVFYFNPRVDESSDEIAHIGAMQRNKAIVTLKEFLFTMSVGCFQANEERLRDRSRCFSVVPATRSQINRYFSARRREAFSPIVPNSLIRFVLARVMLLRNRKEGLVGRQTLWLR
jgi:hypothetical protein